MHTPHWYKWVILLITSISTFFAFGYITTTTSSGTIYYIDRYNERIISNLIGPVQVGLLLVTSLPALYLTPRLGIRVQQLIGAVLFSAGLALTSFTTQSWQGLLLSGVCTGVGGAMMQVATTQMIKMYFPGRQMAPFGAICLAMNSAAMVFPQVWETLISNYGWHIAFYSLGGIGSINILCGLMYIEPSEKAVSEIMSKVKQTVPRLRLVITKRSSSIDLYATAHVVEEKFDNSQRHNSSEEPDEVKEETESGNCDDEGMHASMCSTLKRPQTVAMLIMTFCYSGGLTAGLTVVGDYAQIKLGMTPATIALALTFMGAAQIVSSLLYIFLTSCTEFCATLLHSLCMFVMSVCLIGLCFTTSITMFTVLLSVIGFCKAITTGNSVPLATEMIGLERMMHLYVLNRVLDGIGSAGVPFLAVYMQETFDSSAAIYFAAVSTFVSGCLFVPFYNKYLHKATIKSNNGSVSKDEIATTNYAIF